MNQWPTASIIVLNYNGAQHLRTCFDSLGALDYPADRLGLMCVDNASGDGSVQLMRERFPQVRLVENDANLVFAGGNNAGARAAHGESPAFLNNNTRVPSDWLKSLIRPCLDTPDVACTASRILSWDGQILEFGASSLDFLGYGISEGYGILRPDDCGPQREILFACGGAMAIRRDVFLESGGFDEDYQIHHEGSDLGWRLWLLGHRVMFVPESVVYHRHHGTMSAFDDWKRRLLYERNALFSIVKNYDDENLARVLPVALVLLLKRARYMTGADVAEYRFAPELAGAPNYATEELENPWTLPHYARQTVHTLLKDGPAALATRAREEIKRRRNPPYPPKHIRKPKQTDPTFEQVPRLAVAHLLAADDLIRYWPRLMKKRAWIQAHRRRSDSEIFRLFGQPLAPNFTEDEYLAAQSTLVEAFGIDQLFSQEKE